MGRASGIITHPPGAETRFDWVELPDPPPGWGWGANAHLLVGSLAHSGRARRRCLTALFGDAARRTRRAYPAEIALAEAAYRRLGGPVRHRRWDQATIDGYDPLARLRAIGMFLLAREDP